jgi:hypothetical protein
LERLLEFAGRFTPDWLLECFRLAARRALPFVTPIDKIF